MSSYVVENLAPGTYYFAVRAYTSSGAESANSNVVTKIVQMMRRNVATLYVNCGDRRVCRSLQTFAAARALLFTQCQVPKGKTVERR